MNVLLIAVLTLLNGLFAMSELALASSRKPRLLAMAEDGDNGAVAALNLLEHPTRFLSTVQVGITATGILNGIVAAAIVVTIITFITIIFGELMPKRIGQLYPETVSR